MNNSGRDIGTGLHVAHIYAHCSHNINSLATQTAKRSRLGISRAILVAVYIYIIYFFKLIAWCMSKNSESNRGDILAVLSSDGRL